MANVSKKSKLIVASMAGLLAAGTMAAFTGVAQAEGAASVPCYGINACKGMGDCGGVGHACAGKNACKGAGAVNISKEACAKIAGGKLTA